jgi:hypothetical protein
MAAVPARGSSCSDFTAWGRFDFGAISGLGWVNCCKPLRFRSEIESHKIKDLLIDDFSSLRDGWGRSGARQKDNPMVPARSAKTLMASLA